MVVLTEFVGKVTSSALLTVGYILFSAVSDWLNQNSSYGFRSDALKLGHDLILRMHEQQKILFELYHEIRTEFSARLVSLYPPC